MTDHHTPWRHRAVPLRVLVAATVVLFLVVALFAACSSNGDTNPRPLVNDPTSMPTVPTPTPTEPIPTDEPPVDTPPTVDKTLWFVYENHGFLQVKAGAPWLWEQAGRYAVFMNDTACSHPSLGNYLCMAAGDRLLSDDAEPKSHNLKQQNVFYNAVKAGHTAGIFAESTSTKTCIQSPISKAVGRHIPWNYFKTEAGSYDACKKYSVGLYKLQPAIDAGTLPDVGMVVPNQCSNAHDCSIGKYNAFAKKWVTAVKAGPDYQSGRLLICSTGDEDNRREGNRVLTQCWHESFEHLVVTKKTNHFSKSRLFSQFGHSTPLLKAKTAPDLPTLLGLRIGSS